MSRDLEELRKEIEKIWGRLTEKSFWAEVSINCKKIGVVIEYFPPSEMKVKGLEPEYPPHVWFKNAIIKISHDGRVWQRVGSEYGIQILKLLDPRVILIPVIPPVFKVIEFFMTEREFGFLGEYDLFYLNKVAKPELKLPEELLKWMAENDQKERSIKLILREDFLIKEMIQNDLPPSPDEVTLTFKYKS